MSQVYTILDYESYSEADLKLCGMHEYSIHPSTEILCVAWRTGTKSTIAEAPTNSWCGGDSITKLNPLILALLDPSITLVAHNSGFEQCITKNVLATKLAKHHQGELQSIPVSRWLCTASLAACLALPRSLDGAASALGLPFKKDLEGRRLMLKMSQPRSPTKNDPSTRHLKPEDLKRLVAYCVQDIAVEAALFLKCPPLHPFERRVWELDQKINQRGILTDRKLVTAIVGLVEGESKRLNRMVEDATMGIISTPGQTAAILKWLQNDGVYLPDLRKDTVENALEKSLVKGVSKLLLEFRRAGSKTSTMKYKAFEARSRHDSRLRDILVYHGSSTGRWSGSGVQLQNLPRPKVLKTEDIDFAVKVLNGDWA